MAVARPIPVVAPVTSATLLANVFMEFPFRLSIWDQTPPSEGEQDEELSLDELVVRERAIVSKALERSRWKIYGADGAAALLKIKPTTLVSKMKRLGVRRENG